MVITKISRKNTENKETMNEGLLMQKLMLQLMNFVKNYFRLRW